MGCYGKFPVQLLVAFIYKKQKGIYSYFLYIAILQSVFNMKNRCSVVTSEARIDLLVLIYKNILLVKPDYLP